MAFKKTEGEGKNYLFWIIGGLFGLALLVLFAYSFSPAEGCVGVVEIKPKNEDAWDQMDLRYRLRNKRGEAPVA